MTIGTSSAARATFNCDGVSKNFPVPIQAYAATDLEVILTAPLSLGGSQSQLVLNSDFLLSPSGSLNPNAWQLTTLAPAAYPIGYTLQVFANPVQSQQTQYVQGQGFPSLAIQTNVDRLTQMVQRLQDQINRTLLAPDGDVSPAMLLPIASARASKIQAYDAFGNSSMLTVLPSGTALTQAILAILLNPQTVAEGAAFAVPVSFQYLESSIRRYVAALSVTDNSAAVSLALLVSAIGGSIADLTTGLIPINSTVNVGSTVGGTLYSGSSLKGAGRASILAPNGCDGLTFPAAGDNNYLASRSFEKFQIAQQSGAYSNNGIVLATPFAGGGTPKTTGVKFDNITITGFNQGFSGTGFWNLEVTDLFLYNNYQGVNLSGLNVGINWENGLIQQGNATAAGSPTSYGFLASVVSGQQLQSFTMRGTAISQFNVGINITNGININLEDLNVSFQGSISYQLGAVLGGFNIKNCWANPSGAGQVYGFKLIDLGAAVYDHTLLEGCSAAMAAGSNASIGFYLGFNHMNVEMRNCTSGADGQPFPIGISCAASNAKIKGCTVAATVSAILLNSLFTNMEIGPNVISPGSTQAATMTNGSANIGVTDSTQYPVNSWVQFSITANGATAGVDYYVLSSAANVITVGPIGGSALQMTGSTALNVIAQLPPVQFNAGTPPLFKLYARGAFLAQLVGVTGGVQGIVNWHAEGGQIVLDPPAAFTGAATGTTMSLLGLPQYLWPHATAGGTCVIEDNTVTAMGLFQISTAGVTTFNATVAGGAFTASGTRGLIGRMAYDYN